MLSSLSLFPGNGRSFDPDSPGNNKGSTMQTAAAAAAAVAAAAAALAWKINCCPHHRRARLHVYLCVVGAPRYWAGVIGETHFRFWFLSVYFYFYFSFYFLLRLSYNPVSWLAVIDGNLMTQKATFHKRKWLHIAGYVTPQRGSHSNPKQQSTDTTPSLKIKHDVLVLKCTWVER